MSQISNRERYPTDLTDEQWEELKGIVPEAKPGPQPQIHSRREIVNAILYVARSGCPWRMLPHDLPPYRTVFHYFNLWKKEGIWKEIHDALGRKVRTHAGRKPGPTAAILDSQSVKTTEAGGTRGFDAGKKVKGRKRHLVVDVLGMVLAVVITSANVQDRDAAIPVLREARGDHPTLRKVWVDSAYAGELVRATKATLDLELEVVRRPDISKGFIPVSWRWIGERTFGWINRWRRLSKDYERYPTTTEAMIHVSMTALMVRRISP